MIHGGVKREDRRKGAGAFRNDPDGARAAGHRRGGRGREPAKRQPDGQLRPAVEPNRLEQRFGRIHRIGQTEVCHLWNMVASETREGDVFQRLFESFESSAKPGRPRVRHPWAKYLKTAASRTC